MAQPVTTQFWPIFPCKSDGNETCRQKGLIINNAPNAQQLDRSPNAQGQCDYYRLIDKDEPKHIDWRRKLGGMLLRELGGKQHEDKWAQSILWELPNGYRLYEHIKSKADGQTKPVKNHSGGGHDRQDAYLYGHPRGPKKRFRSPVEFFPHLLWLSTDETGDYDNCTCKLCCPVQLEPEKPAVKQSEPVATSLRKEGSPVVNSATPVPVPNKGQPLAPTPIRRPTTGPQPAQSPIPTPPGPNIARTPQTQPSPISPTPLPQPRSLDQQVDGQYDKFLGRIGEVVWFHREKRQAWGLGVVVRRWLPKDGSSTRAYLIQPLSDPFESPMTEVVTSDAQLKPWLAWSAPACTYTFLQQNPQLTYDQVDWHSLSGGHYGPGNSEVDGSILAAKAIDTTYTLFERLKTTTNMGQEERHWNGIFLGAEKIWNGDPVRLRLGMGMDIMVITDIIERTAAGAPQNGSTTSSSSQIQVIGDVYTFATLQVPNASTPPPIPTNNQIPLRMREDIRWRNQYILPNTQSLAYWKLIAVQQRLDISEIKGRWYETSIVFVDSFKTAIQKKEGGNGIWMNSRGDATGVGKVSGMKVDDRVQALGAAVPKGIMFMNGLEAPTQNNQAKAPSSEMQNLELGVAVPDTGFALDDFMNLEHIDGEGMPFEQYFNH